MRVKLAIQAVYLKSMAQHLEQGDVVTITQYARNSCITRRVPGAAESG